MLISTPDLLTAFNVGFCSDHIFYFSYMHPASKGNKLDLWANADEISRVNRKSKMNSSSLTSETYLKYQDSSSRTLSMLCNKPPSNLSASYSKLAPSTTPSTSVPPRSRHWRQTRAYYSMGISITARRTNLPRIVPLLARAGVSLDRAI